MSYALRGHPRIATTTRARVVATAERLGYRPDPFLSAYMSARRTGLTHPWSNRLAFLTDFPSRDGWDDSPWAQRTLDGAKEAARRRGYAVDVLWRPDLGPTVERAGAVLLHRGIRGVIVSPFPEGKRSYPLPWSEIAAIALDFSLADVAHHCVYHDTAGGVLRALDEVTRRGYRRPAIFMRQSDDLRSDSGWVGGYLDWHFRHHRRPLPPLLFPSHLRDPAVFREWLHRVRPDCVLGLREPFVPEILRELGPARGRPIGYLALNLQDPDPEWAGLLIDGRSAGRHAGELLIRQLETGALGPPASPVKLLVTSRWSDGTSLR